MAGMKKKTGPVSSQPPSPTKAGSPPKRYSSASSGSRAAAGGGHIPNHTFAFSTMPRGRRMAAPQYDMACGPDDGDADDLTPSGSTSMQKKMDSPQKEGGNRQTGASAYETPQDASRGGPFHLRAAAATRTRELAAAKKPFPKKGIIKPSRKGIFTAKAKAAGMSVQQYAAHVMANKNAPPALRRQANFARNFGGAAKKGGSS